MQRRTLIQALAVVLVASTLGLGSGCSIFKKKGSQVPGAGAGSLPPAGSDINLDQAGGAAGRLDLASGTEERGLFVPVYFDYDSAQIRPAERSKLAAVAEGLKSSSKKLLIEGHCDERGTAEYNRALGERRAQSARLALIQMGVNADRITTISYGKDKPAVMDHGDTAWSRNRRCEFVLVR